VSVNVTYLNNFTQGALLVVNASTGQHFAISLDPPPGAAFLGNSIEWIMEAPNGGEPSDSIPQFSPIIFNGAVGLDINGNPGNPLKGFTRTLFRDSTALTSTTLANSQVTIVYLPWHASDLITLTNGPAVSRVSSLAGYATDYNRQHHIIYIGAESDVQELWYGNGWNQADLTQISAAPTNVIGGSSVSGCATEFNNQEHVIYIGNDGNLWELWFSDRWRPNNLTATPGSTKPLSGTPIIGYVTGFNQQQHVIYIGSGGRLCELFFDGSWHRVDLTGATGTVPAAGGAVAAYVTGFNNQQHVICFDAFNHVRELFFDGGWHPNDLTQDTNALAPLTIAALAGTNSEFNRQQHVYYIDSNNHIHEFWFDSQWHDTDITADAGAQAFPPAAGATLDAYATEYNQQLHVNYVGGDNQLHELWFDGQWHHASLSTLSAAALPRARSPLIGYATTYSNQQHVAFIGSDNDVHELWL